MIVIDVYHCCEQDEATYKCWVQCVSCIIEVGHLAGPDCVRLYRDVEDYESEQS